MNEFPASLDRKEWVLWGLEHTTEEWRGLCLQDILTGRTWKDFWPHVSRLAGIDPSPMCRRLADRIIETRKREESLAGLLVTPPSLAPDRYLTEGDALDFELEGLLARKSKDSPPLEILNAWRALLSQHPAGEVAAIGYILLSRFGAEDDARLAEPGLTSSSPLVGMAAVDLLARHPGLFADQIVMGLTSPILPVRFHAIEKLRARDPEEALEHLKPLLEHDDPGVRLSAICTLPLFPFGQTEPLILRFLSAETCPLLMVSAAVAVFMNPHPDLPVTLADLYFVSRGAKRHIVKLTLNKVLESIRVAGILLEDPEAYLARIKTVISERNAAYNRRIALKNLDDPEEEVRITAIQALQRDLNRPEVRKALLDRRERERQPETLRLFEEILGPVERLSAASPLPGRPSGPPEKREEGPQCSSRQEFQRRLKELMDRVKPENEREPILAGLEMFERFGTTAEGKYLVPLLKHANASVVARAIRTLGAIDSDSLRPFLNVLIQKDHPRINAAALEVFFREDKEAALQHLKAMLKSPQPAQRKRALSNFIFVDYPSVEAILLEVFDGERMNDIRVQMGYIIASNPTLSGIQAIFNVSHDDDLRVLADFQEMWDFAASGAVPKLAADRASLEFLCRDRCQKMRDRQMQPAPRYAFQRTRKTVETGRRQSVWPVSARWGWPAAGGGLVVICLTVWFGFQPSTPLAPERVATPELGDPGKQSGVLVKRPMGSRLPGSQVTKDTRRIRGSLKRIPLPPEGEREWEKQ